MISIRDLLHAEHKLHQLVSVLLVVAIGLITSLDSPEGYEEALENKLVSETSLLRFNGDCAEIAGATEKKALGSAKKQKAKHFDEDYVLSWLSSVNFRPSQSGINIDPANTKYKAFYSLGNLRSRYLLLAKYRDYVNLNNQQYGRSIH